MKKIFGAISLSLLGFVVFPSQREVGAAAAADPVQHCLDLVQLNLARKIAPALHVTSHLVPSPPKDLPIQCPAGTLEEIKSALKNQIENCERKSTEEKARTFQFGCRMVKNEDYCLNANTEMLKIATLPNMNYAAFVNRAAQEFDWYESNGAEGNEGKVKRGTTRFTAYYSPTAVDASATPSDVYRFPVYAAPEGLTYFENPKPELSQGCELETVTKLPIHWCIDNKDGTFSPLPTREQIAHGALENEDSEDRLLPKSL